MMAFVGGIGAAALGQPALDQKRHVARHHVVVRGARDRSLEVRLDALRIALGSAYHVRASKRSRVSVRREAQAVASVMEGGEKPRKELARNGAIELLGTAFLAFAVTSKSGAMAAVMAAVVVAAIANALGPFGPILLNPAVTVGMASTEKITLQEAALYVPLQLLGACLGLALTKYIGGATAVAAPALFMGSTNKTVVFELINSAFLMTCIYCASFGGDNSSKTPFVVALAVLSIALLGASCNPAIVFGCAWAAGASLMQFAFWVPQCAGMAVAALLSEHFLVAPKKKKSPTL
ncbi:Aquaporin [Porphyridium purpureum]|uniref:Aquaporin n=1 Tax=Porphyridium purpureum TaxID=35688 RepID=A0A5J4Z1V4_PORPP|nr:Aquaporin [Porphyridium purpureum]|eukprot:POR0626..scf208_2